MEENLSIMESTENRALLQLMLQLICCSRSRCLYKDPDATAALGLVEPVDTAGGIRAATVRLTQVCRYGPLPMTLVDKFHQKCGV